MKPTEVKIRWFCGDMDEEYSGEESSFGCGDSFNTVESLVEWEGGSSHADCPKCKTHLDLSSGTAIEKGVVKDSADIVK